MSNPFFSICIPVYKNVQYLKVLLESTWSQSFTDFEVVITDDTPDDSVEKWLQSQFPDKHYMYYRNPQALGTPENWNEAIRRASGQWIKLMHNDDWFYDSGSLAAFYQAVKAHPGTYFFFSAYENVYSHNGTCEEVRMGPFDKWFLRISPLHLFRKVYVGNPSCTLIHASVKASYDNRLKFVVDFEYYMRLIQQGYNWVYIDKPLLKIGMHDEQVTQYTKYNPAVQVYENVIMLQEYGEKILRNIFVFDYYWRLFRNIGIRTVEDAQGYYKGKMPAPLVRMLKLQQHIPLLLLKTGVFSKLLMTCAYLNNVWRK